MSFNLTRKNALITGAAHGIGAALASQLAGQGCRLCLIDIDSEQLTKTADSIRKRYSAGPIVLAKDLSDSKQRESIFTALEEKGFDLDVLVNNVSVGYWREFTDTPWYKLEQIIDTNVKCLTHMTKLALPSLLNKDEALIVNLSSTAGFIGSLNGVCYSGTKGYIRIFSEALDMELRDTGVKVLTVFPGATATKFWENALMEESGYFKKVPKLTSDEVAGQIVAAIKRGKINVITGRRNKVNMLAVKFLPREWVKNAAIKRFKD